MPATHGLLGRILRVNDDAVLRFGQSTAEVDAFIQAAALLTPFQWRQVLAARRRVSTVTKEDVDQATASLEEIKAAIRGSTGRMSESMSTAGEWLLEALDTKSADKIVAAWQALSALVMRNHLSPLKFAAHYAPFVALVPVSGIDALDPSTLRYLDAVQRLTREQCDLLAKRWHLDHETSRSLVQVVARSHYLKAEEAAALIALRTIPNHLTGDPGWSAIKTVVHGGRVIGSRAVLSREQVGTLWAPLEAAIPLASVDEVAAKPVRGRVRAAVEKAATAIAAPVAAVPARAKRAASTRLLGPYGPNSAEVATFIKAVVEMSPIQWLRVLDRGRLVATVTRQGGTEPASVVRSLLAAIRGTKDLDMSSRCRAFAAVERAAGTLAVKGQLTHDESMQGYGALGEIVELDYVDAGGFAKVVATLTTGDWDKVAASMPNVNEDVVGPLVNAGAALTDFLVGRSDNEAVAAWHAASALVRRQHLAPIKFAAAYAAFASAIPVTNPRSLGAPVHRYITAVGRLSANQCALLARPWHIEDDLSTALTKAVAGGGGRTAEEAVALAAVVTVPMRVSGSEGWAAAKTAAYGGRVIGSRSRLSLEQLEVLWRPIQPAIPLSSLVAVTKSRR